MGKCGQAEKQQQMRAFWPVPATSADVMAVGDLGLTVTKGKGRYIGAVLWISQAHAFREGLADFFCRLHGGAFPGEALRSE